MIKTSKKLFLGVIFIAVNLPLLANELIQITHVSMPEIPAVSRTAAIYLTIHNQSDKNVILTDVSTEVANHAMFHFSQEINGVAKMQHVNELIIPANGQFEFTPKGYHIMLMGLDKNLMSKPFNVRLEFNDLPAKLFIVGN